MEIMRGGGGQFVRRHGGDAAGFDDDDVVGVLHGAFYFQKRFLRDDEPQFLEKFGRDDGVAHARFIFQADENKTFGRAGTLAANDVAGNPHYLPVPGLGKIARGPNARQLRAHQGHGMRAGG